MTNRLKQVLFLHIVVAISLFILSKSFQFFPFVDMEYRIMLEDFIQFLTLFSLPISFLIFMFGIAKDES